MNLKMSVQDLELLINVFDVQFVLQHASIASESIDKYSYNRAMKMFPLELWNMIEYRREVIFIYENDIKHIMEFLKGKPPRWSKHKDYSTDVDFEASDLHEVIKGLDDVIYIINGASYANRTIGNYIEFNSGLEFEQQDEDLLLKLVPDELKEFLFIDDNNKILFSLEATKRYYEWFRDPFPSPHLSPELSYFKLDQYIKSFIYGFSYDEDNTLNILIFRNVDDFILQQISAPHGNNQRIIDNISEAYAQAYKLYHGYRSIVQDVIPDISNLGIFDY